MDDSYILRIIIADRSGSMNGILKGMQSGYDEFIASQRLLAERNKLRVDVSLWQFDEEVENVFSFASLDQAASWKLEPRGWTALNDGVCMAVDGEGSRLSGMPEHERPFQVSVLIITDGQENRSRRFTREQARARLAHQRETYNWDVTFLGSVNNLQYMPSDDSALKSFSAVAGRYERVTLGAMDARQRGVAFDPGLVSYTDRERSAALGNSGGNG
jgi:uncharacterized protein YegL